jgi:hypothetical protein
MSSGLAGLVVLAGATEALAGRVPARSVEIRSCLTGFVVAVDDGMDRWDFATSKVNAG